MNPQLLQQQIAQTLSKTPDNRGVPQQQYDPMSDPQVLQALAQVQQQQTQQALAQQQQWQQMMAAAQQPQPQAPIAAQLNPKY